ncbi:MAG TPA: hypothetical protein VFD59_08025 [Nocardioidaceae bacterium]|nr:hypothetical protein [Nocardioidaceae bacterium]
MRISLGVFLLAVSLALFGGPIAVGAPADDVWMTFDSGSLATGRSPGSVTNLGSADVTARVVTLDGGEATRVTGHGPGEALRFPAFSGSSNPPRAVLRITNDGSPDQLNPGTARFSFGADLRLRKESEGTRADNGNNVLQRGLYEDAAQYKLDVDGRRPGCRVKGASGTVSVRSAARVNPRDWYRVACTRDESAVTMRVVQFLEGGGRRTSTKSASGPTGVVVMSSPRTPMSVAGKLQTDGRLVPSTDQFNGVIDRVFLRIG